MGIGAGALITVSTGGGGSSTPNTMAFPWGGMVGAVAATALSAANKIQISGFYLPNSVTVNNIVVSINTPDAANNYDWGVYDSTGALKVHVGAHVVPASGVVDLPVLASATLAAGKYYFAYTGNATVALITAAPNNVSTKEVTFLALVESATASAGGALPATITIPADTWAAASASVHGFVLH